MSEGHYARRYIVVETTPGYLPDVEPLTVEGFAEAVEKATNQARELVHLGYTCRVEALTSTYYSIYCERADTVAPDLGRRIEVVVGEEGTT